MSEPGKGGRFGALAGQFAAKLAAYFRTGEPVIITLDSELAFLLLWQLQVALGNKDVAIPQEAGRLKEFAHELQRRMNLPTDLEAVVAEQWGVDSGR